MDKMYLVGKIFFSGDTGELPNTSEFPKYCFATLEEAEAKYNELAKQDDSWGYGFVKAYLAEAVPGEPFKALKGRLSA